MKRFLPFAAPLAAFLMQGACVSGWSNLSPMIHSCRSNLYARGYRGQQFSRNLPTCAAVSDESTWEDEYRSLPKPPPKLQGVTPFLGQFGNMLQGLVNGGDGETARASQESETVKAGPVSDVPTLDGHAVVNEYPHNGESFTQGLWWCSEDNMMYEGGGGAAFSHGTRISRYNLDSGEVDRGRQLPDRFFGEGICGLGDKLYQLTWRSNVGFVYDRKTMKLTGQWNYEYEGWGMTSDGTDLIISDGSATLRFVDPNTFTQKRALVVRSRGKKSNAMAPLRRLNDLQWVKGEILANVWESDRIAVIDPASGVVKRFIECKGLLDEKDPWIKRFNKSDRCLNGIAYDERNDRLLVTGKLWTKIYEIEVLPGMGEMMESRAKSKAPNYYASKGTFDPLGMN